MAVKIDVHYKNSVSSPKPQEATFAQLEALEKNIPKHFPGLEKFEKIGNQEFRWTFQKVKYGKYDFQIKVVTRFQFAAPNRIEMVSVPQPDHSDLHGSWTVSSEGGASKVVFDVNLGVELPLPFFLKSMAAPIAQKELSKIFDRYLSNVGKALST